MWRSSGAAPSSSSTSTVSDGSISVDASRSSESIADVVDFWSVEVLTRSLTPSGGIEPHSRQS